MKTKAYEVHRPNLLTYCLDMLYSTPNIAQKTITEVFPAETSGRGNPVGGMLPVTTSAFTSDCMPNIPTTPTESIYPKKSLQLTAIFIPR